MTLLGVRARRVHGPLGMTLAMLVVVGCSAPPPEPTKLQSVDLGTAVDAGNGITEGTRIFDAHSVVYLAIATEGATPGTLTVQWYANTALIDTETLLIHPTGPAKFAFHYRPTGGWPAGKSRVIFYLSADDQHAAEFTVR